MNYVARYHKTVVIFDTHDMGMLEIADTLSYRAPANHIKENTYTEISKIEPKEHIHTKSCYLLLKG